MNNPGIFPEADKDPVIQIANMVVNQGEKTPFIRNVFTLDTCAPIVGSKVYSYAAESELLKVRFQFTVCLLSLILRRVDLFMCDVQYDSSCTEVCIARTFVLFISQYHR